VVSDVGGGDNDVSVQAMMKVFKSEVLSALEIFHRRRKLCELVCKMLKSGNCLLP
jgi:hypothetical protein